MTENDDLSGRRSAAAAAIAAAVALVLLCGVVRFGWPVWLLWLASLAAVVTLTAVYAVFRVGEPEQVGNDEVDEWTLQDPEGLTVW